MRRGTSRAPTRGRSSACRSHRSSTSTAASALTGCPLTFGTGPSTVTRNAPDTAFTGWLTILGGTGDDTVVFVEKSGAGTYTFNGNGGSDTLVGPDIGNVWTVTGAD